MAFESFFINLFNSIDWCLSKQIIAQFRYNISIKINITNIEDKLNNFAENYIFLNEQN